MLSPALACLSQVALCSLSQLCPPRKDCNAPVWYLMQVEFSNGTTGEQYLTGLRPSLHKAFAEFAPDIVLYNAGTDVLGSDALGNFR